MKTVAFIPVRGGSKSIPGKNILSFNGKPLLYWTAKAAQDCPEISEIIIATDSQEIADTANSLGLSKISIYHRSAKNANDKASTESVMLEYLETSNLRLEDRFILIQATNPFLLSDHLIDGINLLNQQPQGSIISCATFKRFLWNRDGSPMNYDFMNRPRRQDFDGAMLENGAFYINTVGNILETQNRLTHPIAIVEMPEYSAVEIDEPEDWMIAEKIHRKHILTP
jgi:N-acylneuraminate cytidylyltransferase